MRKSSIYIGLLVIVMSCTQSKPSFNVLENMRDVVTQRTATLHENYRYNILIRNNAIFNVELILAEIDMLKSMEEVNERFSIIADSLGVELYQIDNRDFEVLTLLNKIVILDKLLFLANMTEVNFSKLDVATFIESESNEKTTFRIALTVSDSLFKPEFELFVKNDTFPLDVDESGQAIFSIQKSMNNQNHSFRGDAIFYLDSLKQKRIPFLYGSID